MAGYIGSKTSVTQVDGYNRTEADDEFVNDPNSVISVSGSNVGIGTSSPDGSDWNGSSTLLHLYQNSTNGSLLKLESSNTSAVMAAGNNQLQLGTIEAQPFNFYTSATERLRIDSSGRVTTPYQPAFRAYLSSNTSKPSGFSVVPGTFATNYNVGGHYSTSTSRFTAPVSGSYLFTGTIATSGSQGSFDYLSCEFWVNGGREFIGGWQGNSSPSYSKSASSIVLILNANDYVELACETNKTFSMQGSGSSSSNYTYMTGYLLG